MFRWYQSAAKCYAYLSDVLVPEEIREVQAFPISWAQSFRQSRWFARGWTLQELLAPANVEFFSQGGKRLGSRVSLEREVHEITNIPVKALRGQQLAEFSIAERMSWTAGRTTTFKEDRIYCLLGIFGVYLPLIYGEGEAYAELRLREEIEKREKGQGIRRVQDLAASSPLPFSRNEHFTGREDELQALDEFLRSSKHRRISICGLGGCGKSALAIEFGYLALSQRTGLQVFWVAAISRDSFELAYREIGVRLRVPGITDDNADIKQLVKDALNSGIAYEWLMIVDNADDPQILVSSSNAGTKVARLADYLPDSDRGKIIFTTRNRKAAGDLTQSSKLEVKDMGEVEARQLLSRRITKQALLADAKATNALLELLAYLPLAIIQAAAFIDNNDMAVSRYVTLLQTIGSQAKLFAEQFEDPNRYQETERTVAKTWYISFDQMRKQDKLAAEYLSFMACIDRINIPQSLLPPCSSLVQQAKAIGTLKAYTFVTERQQLTPGSVSEASFDVHRLVHLAMIWWLNGQSEQKAWVIKAAARLEELVPYGGHENKEKWTRYLAHADHVAGSEGMLEDKTRASLLDRVGRCQASLGLYAAAEIAHRQALSIREKVLGEEHPDTLTSMNNLAGVLGSQGKYEAAESMHRQALAIREKVLGAEHPDTLMSMNNLALVLGSQGKYEAAESMHRQALAICEKVLGAEHPSTLTSMNNLALVLDRQGKYGVAESMHRQALAMWEKVLGAEHPDTLTSMNNLAGVLGSQGKYEAATTLYDRTYTGLIKVLGKGHPHTRTCYENYSDMLASQSQSGSGSVSDGLNVGENLRGKKEATLLRIVRRLGFRNARS
ncbi:hypothetical protein LTS10_013212 [Elasticomyces elasticus]|nr:hypothetical protein LTS10_013212 [Elasticomyces elasticus]